MAHVHLDPRLNFKHHVSTWCGKALKAAQHIRRLNSVNRGATPGSLIQVIDACIIPVATYGAEVWWPGINRPTARGIVTCQTSHLCGLINKVIRTALRAALPVWKTTPNEVLHREGGIPTAQVILEGNRLRLAARLNTLDDHHPLRSRASMCPNEGTLKYKSSRKASKRPEIKMSRIQRALRQLPRAENAVPLTPPGYLDKHRTKSEEIKMHSRWVNSIPETDICAYSDGASEGHGRSSWGFVLQRGGTTFHRNSGPLHGYEVYDAEITGAFKALESAMTFSREDIHIYILVDNQAAVLALSTGKSVSSLQVTREFWELANRRQVTVKWVPGHSQIKGNEEADIAARSALAKLPPFHTVPLEISQAYLKRLMQMKRQVLINEWWSKACPARYSELDLQMRRRKPPELTLPRRLLHELIAARTGHGNFAAYHRRFHHDNATVECVCGRETNPTHFIRCQRHAHLARRMTRFLPHSIFVKKLLGPKCHESFLKFARVTSCFGKIPNEPSSALSEDRNL